MKNPNGYGCIKLLSGSRRRPYCFVVSQQGKQKVIGYFATKLEAMAYQVDYNQSHGLHRLSDNKITFAELYARWLPKHIEYSSVSDSTIHGYESAYKHCRLLYDLPVSDIKYSHLQTVIEGDFLLCDESGDPYGYSRLSRLFSRVMKLIHGEKYKPHDTRHTCATLLDAVDVNDNARKMILGHARHDVTNGVYTHKNLRQLRKAIEKI